MLWLCLHLPLLPLEIRARDDRNRPQAIVAGEGARRHLVLVDEPAARRGLTPGMRLSAALALADDLLAHAHDPAAESGALARLAGWCGQFTPLVNLAPPDALLLEIEGSLRLFGGSGVLLKTVRAGVADLGYSARLAACPTPTAASLLARAGVECTVTDLAQLPAALARLPVRVLDLPGAAHKRLQRIGVATLGECLRLPREGLARRFGPELLAQLDRARGAQPDPRATFEPPPRFAARMELPAETRDASALLFALHRLVQELAGLLAARGAGVDRLRVRLHHDRRAPHEFTLGLGAPSRDPAHVTALLRERLARVELAAPALAVGLAAEDFQPLAQRSLDWLPGGAQDADNERQLVERLRARLGTQAVHGLHAREDHRPERAWSCAEPGVAGVAPDRRPRPAWLLAAPRALGAHDGHPLLHGVPLTLLAGPERIESGWWDGEDVRRDYYVACDRRGERLWIFREHGGGWFLHGLLA